MSRSAELVHHIPGRLRLRIPLARGNPGQLLRIKESLEAMEGVRRVDMNAKLGSAVIQYDPALFPALSVPSQNMQRGMISSRR